MTKMELIESLRETSGITKKDAQSVVETFFNDMTEALAKGDRVEIRGLFSFQVKKYPPYTSRNPRTGEQVRVKSKKLPVLKCGKGLKDRLNPHFADSDE